MTVHQLPGFANPLLKAGDLGNWWAMYAILQERSITWFEDDFSWV